MLLQEFLCWNEPINPKTRQDMEWAVRRYLSWLEYQGISDAMDVNAHSFSGFMKTSAGRYTDGTLHDLQLFLKKFHRFLNEQKGLEIPFEFVLSLPVVREKKIFSPLTKDEIQRTIAQVDRSTVMGKRDYAIILLGARSGLRGSDIIHLKLTDIDWRGGEIRLVQQKTGGSLALPLLPDVGEALKEYILNGRPSASSEFVFLRAVHPYLPFNRTMALSHLWSGYQKKAGIERYAHDGKGFHALQRTLGKELTLAEVPVTTTAQILDHQSMDSTKQYISLDIEQYLFFKSFSVSSTPGSVAAHFRPKTRKLFNGILMLYFSSVKSNTCCWLPPSSPFFASAVSPFLHACFKTSNVTCIARKIFLLSSANAFCACTMASCLMFISIPL